MPSLDSCKCNADKDRRRREDCEIACINAQPVASISISCAGLAQAAIDAAPDQQEDANQLIPAVTSPPTLRIWGLRTFQPPADNSAQAQEYWRQVSESRQRRQAKAALTRGQAQSELFEHLQQLTPGSGPGVPLHLPLSYSTVPNKITSIACGETFVACLTEAAEIYVLGQGQHGELGSGPKVGVLRDLQLVSFADSCAAQGQPERQNTPSSAIPNLLNATLTSTNSFGLIVGQPVAKVAASINSDLTIVAVAAGNYHCLALNNDGQVYVWGHAASCGLMTVEHVWRPTPMARYVPSLEGCKVLAIAAEGDKSAMLGVDSTLYIWGAWLGIAPVVEPLAVARLQLDEDRIQEAQLALGESMGLLTIRMADKPERSYVYQIGVGVRGEVLPIKTVNNDPEVPRFTRLCEKRYNMYVPEYVTPQISAACEPPCLDIIDIAVGKYHALVLTSDHRLITYGDDTWGQCGTGGEHPTHIAPPSCVFLHPSIVPARIYAGGNQSAMVTTSGATYAWGCPSNFRLANASIKLTAEAPMRSLAANATPGVASLGRPNTIGSSTQMSVHNAIKQPERILALAPFTATAVGLGAAFSAVATGQ